MSELLISSYDDTPFLKWNKDTDEFAVNEYNQDQSKLIIVDETSMVDIML